MDWRVCFLLCVCVWVGGYCLAQGQELVEQVLLLATMQSEKQTVARPPLPKK